MLAKLLVDVSTHFDLPMDALRSTEAFFRDH